MNDILRTDCDGVAELRLNRPERRNALSTTLLLELREHLRTIRDDADVRVVVLCGAGEVFCAGADMKEFGPDASPALSLARIRLVSEVLAQLTGLEQPTLAAVRGPAVGAGWGLALACDLCFATDGATFSLPEVAKGLRLPAVLVRRLVRVVGPVRAADIVFGGDSYTTDEAIAAGWVTRRLTEPDDLIDYARQFARQLAPRPRHSIAAAKQPLRELVDATPNPPLEYVWTEELAT